MRKTLQVVISAATACALFGFPIGCSKRPSDETIAKDIQTKVAADPDTKDSQVTVASKDGKVTLTGTASTPAAQQKLEAIARQEPGIAGVENQVAVPPPPPPPPPIVVAAGTDLVITLSQSLGSKTSQSGQTFLATVARPVTVGDQTAIPKGSSVTGTVITAKEKGKIKGEGNCPSRFEASLSMGKPIRSRPVLSTVRSKARGSVLRQLPVAELPVAR